MGFYAAIDLLLMIAFCLVARRLSLGGVRQVLLAGDSREALEIARTLEANEHRGLRRA